MMSKVKVKKVLNVISNVFLYAFLVLAIVLVIVSVVSKKSGDDAVTLFGKQMRIVTTASMEKCDQTDVSEFDIKDIPVRSMVFIDVVPTEQADAKSWYEDLKIGDVCTFRYKLGGEYRVITHRIIDIKELSDGLKIDFQGDNKVSDADNVDLGVQTIYTSLTNPAHEVGNDVIGKVTGQSKVFGFLAYIVMQPIGLALIVIVPCAIIIVLEVVKIFSVFGAEKREKVKAEQEKQQSEIDKQQSEIDELKRQLAMLSKEREQTETKGDVSDQVDGVSVEKTEDKDARSKIDKKSTENN